jgi:hypothetical protein
MPPMPVKARYNSKCVAASELGLSLPSTTLPSGQRHDHHLRRLQHGVGNAGRLDDHQAARPVQPAGIAKGLNHQTFFNQLQVGLADAFLSDSSMFSFKHARDCARQSIVS